MYDFQQFTNIGSSYAPKISIRQNGSIGLSQGALRKFKLEEGAHFIALFYDQTARVIGLRPTQDATAPGVVQLQRRPVKSKGKTTFTAQISVRSFLDFCQIEYQGRKQSFTPIWNEEHQMILLDLKNPRPNATDDEEEPVEE